MSFSAAPKKVFDMIVAGGSYADCEATITTQGLLYDTKSKPLSAKQSLALARGKDSNQSHCRP